MNTFFIMVIVALLAQSAPATVDGIVIKMGSGEPLAGARVELHPERSDVPDGPEPPETYTATTSQDGRFVLNGVVPGPYRLIATRNGGYVPAEYGQRRPTGQGIPFELSAGQRMSGIQLAMASTGVIARQGLRSRWRTDRKSSSAGASNCYKDGRRALTIVQTAETNERGEYRLFWLTPGRYYVSARPDIPELPANMGSDNGGTIGTVRNHRSGSLRQLRTGVDADRAQAKTEERRADRRNIHSRLLSWRR